MSTLVRSTILAFACVALAVPFALAAGLPSAAALHGGPTHEDPGGGSWFEPQDNGASNDSMGASSPSNATASPPPSSSAAPTQPAPQHGPDQARWGPNDGGTVPSDVASEPNEGAAPPLVDPANRNRADEAGADVRSQGSGALRVHGIGLLAVPFTLVLGLGMLMLLGSQGRRNCPVEHADIVGGKAPDRPGGDATGEPAACPEPELDGGPEPGPAHHLGPDAAPGPTPDPGPTPARTMPNDPARVPGFPGILLMGKRAVDAGSFSQALAWFDCAVRLDPAVTAVHVCRGVCLLALDRAEEAAVALELAAERDPGDLVTWYHLAQAHGRAGHPRRALDALGRVLVELPELAPDVAEDPAFVDLADHPWFLQLVGRL